MLLFDVAAEVLRHRISIREGESIIGRKFIELGAFCLLFVIINLCYIVILISAKKGLYLCMYFIG